MTDYYARYNANVHRGIHLLSEEATAAYEGARKEIAQLIGAPAPATVLFTRNTTEGINLVAHAWGEKNISAGDEILLTEMEHHANLVPWQMLAGRKKARLSFLSVNTGTGELALEELEQKLTDRTKLVAVTLMSNVLGTINPVKQIVQAAHAKGIPVLVDGAQGVPHLPVNVLDLNCDFLAFSAHKMLGPTGVGVLYGKEALLEQMDPFLGGGDMIRDVWLDRATWNDLPWKFEAGTPDIGGAIAFGAAVAYLKRLGMENVRAHERAITEKVLARFKALSGVTLYGPTDPEKRGAAFSFNVAGVHPHDLGQIFDDQGIAVRAGHHCCKPLMRKLGIVAAARASFYLYNNESEIDRLIEAIHKAQEMFSVVAHR